MLILGISFIASFFVTIAASASENIFKITNTSFIEASQNVEEDFEATDEASITQAILFHKVGDYAKFKITFNNSDSIKHTIESITDDNSNEYVSLEYADYTNTEVSAGDSFDFIITIKYITAVDDLGDRDQATSFKLYIKYAESEEPDEIDVNPSSPDTSDNFKIAVTILAISATGLIICLVISKKTAYKAIKIITIVAIVASAFTISLNTEAASEGIDVLVFSSEFNLYDKLAITINNNGNIETVVVDYDSTVDSIAKPEAPTGYEFETWKDENGDPVSDSTKLTQDTKLIAGFKAKTYYISYKGLESDEEQGLPTDYTIETNVSIAPLATRKDSDGDNTQAFAGWKDENDTISQSVTIPTGQTGNKTFEATWTDLPLPSYTASCDIKGGQGTESYTFNKKTDTFAIQNPSKDYYNFTGWSGTDLEGEANINVQVIKGTRKNLQFEAHYTPINYTITYNGLTTEESAGLTKKYTVETDSISLSTPNNRTSEDEYFDKWTSDDVNVSNPSNISLAGKHENITITANWKANTHTIGYNLNDGTTAQDNPTEFTKDTDTFTLYEPTKTGYIFKGWSGTDLTGDSNKNVQVAKSTKKDLNFEAHYTAISYTIDYQNVENSEIAAKELPTSYTIETAKTIVKLDNRVDSDGDTTQRFVGWKTENESTTSETINIPVGTTDNKKYIAVWEAVEYPSYNITYELDGADNPGNKTSYKKTDENYILNNPSKNGYNFSGWTCEQLNVTSPVNEFTIPQGTRGALTIVAHFSAIEYTISYTSVTDAEKAPLTQTYTINDSVTINPLANRTDEDDDIMQSFVGWSNGSDSEPVSTISFSNETGNKSYTAIWHNEAYPPVYNITYNLNEGTANNPATYTKQDSNFTLNNPTKTGYNFTGWSGSHLEGEDNINVTVQANWKENLTFTAHYNPIQYHINFDINAPVATDSQDTTDQISNVTCTYNSSCTLANNTYNIIGYTFDGWNTQANGSGQSYNSGETINTNLSDTDNANITLYAQWIANQDTEYTIEFYFENINDKNFTKDDDKTDTKSGTTDTQTATIDLAQYTYNGFTFDADNANNKLQDTIERHGSTILKLYYTRDAYEITFNANGGKISDTNTETTTVTAKYGASITQDNFPALTAKENSDFTGWFTTADDSGEKITSDIIVDGTKTFYAHWEIPTICKKATELHVETCANTSGGCFKNQYSAETSNGGIIHGKKNTSTIVYGEISDGENLEIGDAFDCDVNGDKTYSATDERFYYIRNNNGKAVLVYSSNFEGDHVGTAENYLYSDALLMLPTTDHWGGLERTGMTYHTDKVARFLDAEDVQAIFENNNRKINVPFTNDFVLEKTGYFYYNYPESEETIKPGLWTEIVNASGNHYRIHSNSLEYNNKGDTVSWNVVRPVIEVPMTYIDQNPVETVTLTFNTLGGEPVPQLTIGKGNAFRDRATTTKTGYEFKGWCLDSSCNTPVNYSTIFNSNTTLYANWELISITARIGDEYYNSLADAIEAVPSDNVETEVVLLRDVTEATINVYNNQNILLKLGDHTFTAKSKNAISLNSGSKMTLASGTITSSQPKDAAINVNDNSEFYMTGGKIQATGQRAAIFANGGDVYIYDGAELSSTSNERATVHNTCKSETSPSCSTPGTINIYGGTIESTGAYAIFNETGTLNIGSKDGTINPTSPTIRGKTYGVIAYPSTSNGVNFYDGYIEGKNYPTGRATTNSYNPGVNPNTDFSIITNIENNYQKQLDDSSEYKKLYLVSQ